MIDTFVKWRIIDPPTFIRSVWAASRSPSTGSTAACATR